VRAHSANSHSNRGWEQFTQRIIDLVAKKRTKGVVFLAWGSPAAKRVVKVDKVKHCVLLSVHPSPLSARRGFFECGHFRKTNEWLADRYGADEVIDWNLGDVVPQPKAVVPVKAVEPVVAAVDVDEDAEQAIRDAEEAIKDAETSKD